MQVGGLGEPRGEQAEEQHVGSRPRHGSLLRLPLHRVGRRVEERASDRCHAAERGPCAVPTRGAARRRGWCGGLYSLDQGPADVKQPRHLPKGGLAVDPDPHRPSILNLPMASFCICCLRLYYNVSVQSVPNCRAMYVCKDSAAPAHPRKRAHRPAAPHQSSPACHRQTVELYCYCTDCLP